MLSLMTLSTSASDLPKPDYSCLTRPQKEKIEVAFEQNDQCHKSLANVKSIVADEMDWVSMGLALVIGMAGGMIIQSQLHR